MHRLIPTLIEVMGDAYPELISQQSLIGKVMKEEEESFLRTLETGIKLLEKNMPTKEGGVLSGEVAFQLYDTFGFPLDLTELILREHGMSVDVASFSAEMLQQKERARNAAVETGDWTKVYDGEPEFTGYDETESVARILRFREVKQKKQEILSDRPFPFSLLCGDGWTGRRYGLADHRRRAPN